MPDTAHQLQNIPKPPPCFTVGMVTFFFERFIHSSVNIELIWLQFCLICPKDVLPEALWLVSMNFSKCQSAFLCVFLSTVESSLVHCQNNRWCDLTLNMSISCISFGSFSWPFVHVYTILFNLGSIFLLQPCSGRLAKLASTLNILEYVNPTFHFPYMHLLYHVLI